MIMKSFCSFIAALLPFSIQGFELHYRLIFFILCFKIVTL
jgi:hypothetical protein